MLGLRVCLCVCEGWCCVPGDGFRFLSVSRGEHSLLADGWRSGRCGALLPTQG